MQSGGVHGRPRGDDADRARPDVADRSGDGTDGEPAEGPTDGRTARRIRNEAAVVDAMIELITEGEFEPTAEQIADRAGVSHRSVYRYFSSRTELIGAVIGRVLERISPVVFFEHVGEGAFDERVERFVEARLVAYGDFGPIVRAAFRRAVIDDTVGDAIDDARTMMREQLVRHFDPELSAIESERRPIVIALLDAVLQFESLEHLSGRIGLDDAELADAVTTHLEVYLRPYVTS